MRIAKKNPNIIDVIGIQFVIVKIKHIFDNRLKLLEFHHLVSYVKILKQYADLDFLLFTSIG
jgi:hypothetical protein